MGELAIVKREERFLTLYQSTSIAAPVAVIRKTIINERRSYRIKKNLKYKE
jgi:hypothetical protein